MLWNSSSSLVANNVLVLYDAEANIHQDMTQCRDAVRGKNWQLVRSLAHGVAAKARRVADIGKMAAEQAPEPWKKEAIASAVGKLEQGGSLINLCVSMTYSLCMYSHSSCDNHG